MFRMQRMVFLLIAGALAVLSYSASAQDAAVPAEKLVQKYTVLAGSEDNARNLVAGLRNGSEIQLTGADGSSTSFTPLTGKMGLGNVNIALALTQAQLASVDKPTIADIQNALMNADNGVLALRAQKMGWGEIAHPLGFKLGDLVRAPGARPEKGNERVEPQRLAGDANASRGRPDARPERAERLDRPERGGGRPERTMP